MPPIVYLVEATHLSHKSLLNMCGVPGMVQLLGTQLGEADKVLAFMGLPSWRWCQVVASASEDQNRRKVGEVRLLYGG